MDVRVGLWRKLSAKKLMLLNCVLAKTLQGPLDCKEILPVHPKGDQSWVLIGRTDAEAETPTLWPPHAKSWLIGKDPDAGREWGQEEKGTTEDEMAGWHHRLNGHGFEKTLGVGDGQGDLACCDLWGCKESDTTEWLNWAELNWRISRNDSRTLLLKDFVTTSLLARKPPKMGRRIASVLFLSSKSCKPASNRRKAIHIQNPSCEDT